MAEGPLPSRTGRAGKGRRVARVRLYEKTETVTEPKGVRDSQVMAIPETGLPGVGAA